MTKSACPVLFYKTYNCRTSVLNSHFNNFLNYLKLSLPDPLLAQLAIWVSTTFGRFVHFAVISHWDNWDAHFLMPGDVIKIFFTLCLFKIFHFDFIFLANVLKTWLLRTHDCSAKAVFSEVFVRSDLNTLNKQRKWRYYYFKVHIQARTSFGSETDFICHLVIANILSHKYMLYEWMRLINIQIIAATKNGW